MRSAVIYSSDLQRERERNCGKNGDTRMSFRMSDRSIEDRYKSAAMKRPFIIAVRC